MDYNDIEIRCAYGNRYQWLTPICKTLLACLVHKDWLASGAVYSRMSDYDRSVLLPIHRDLASHLCRRSNKKKEEGRGENEIDMETAWLKEVFNAWKANKRDEANSILQQHYKDTDKLSLYWIDHVIRS